jgi:hypothetical protein
MIGFSIGKHTKHRNVARRIEAAVAIRSAYGYAPLVPARRKFRVNTEKKQRNKY